MKARDCPGGAMFKNPPANAGDTGSSPGPGRSHMPRGAAQKHTNITMTDCYRA